MLGFNKRCLLGCWFAVLSGAAVADDPRAHADYYINVFGEVIAEGNAKVSRAHQVFERVRNVAEDPIGFTPKLKVINSEGQPWAVALPDGYVILSRGALDICYNAVSQARGDARLAFVLGHELAHLVSRDFWHRNVFLSLSGIAKGSGLSSVKRNVAAGFLEEYGGGDNIHLEALKRKELQADDTGFLYASLAGYNTTLIIDQDQSKEFLNNWVKQTRTVDDHTHFGPKERSSFLKARFSRIKDKVAYFKAGIQLMQFGRLRDAQYLFEAFAQSFPSHEVETNLGYVHLQQALQYFSDEQRYQYWLPLRLVDIPHLFRSSRSLGSSIPLSAKQHLQEAEKYLNKAANSRSDDIPSRINLASVYFLLGEFYKARARIEEARSLDDTNVDTLVLRALILNEQEKDIDMWPVAVRILRRLSSDGQSLSARYNLARLYQQRGKKMKAKREWLTLQTQFEYLPQVYRRSICLELGGSTDCDASLTTRSHSPSALIDTNLMNYFKSLETLVKSGWRTTTLRTGPLTVKRFLSRRKDEILTIDGNPMLLTDQLDTPISLQQLEKGWGNPSERQSLGLRELWKYGASSIAVVDQGNVTELWHSSF